MKASVGSDVFSRSARSLQAVVGAALIALGAMGCQSVEPDANDTPVINSGEDPQSSTPESKPTEPKVEPPGGLDDINRVVVTPLGDAQPGQAPTIDLTLPFWSALHQVGLFTIDNRSNDDTYWNALVSPNVEWLKIPREGALNTGELTTFNATIIAEALKPGDTMSAMVTLSAGDQAPETVKLNVVVQPQSSPDECVYIVTLKKITVVAGQAIGWDGFNLEPIVDLNAVGIGRLTSPPAGNHNLGVGQFVAPNRLIGAPQSVPKGTPVTVQVIADLDEIDFPPVNPDDLRNQGQSGVANFNFECNGVNSLTQIIPIPVVGNAPGEGNGMIEVEIEVSWDP